MTIPDGPADERRPALVAFTAWGKDMRLRTACVVLAFSAGCRRNPPAVSSPDTRPAAGGELTIDDLNRRPVIGRLDVPLGKLVTIDATVVSGDTLGSMASQGRYLLRVDRVDGRPIASPPVFDFQTLFVTERMPTRILDWSDDRRNGGERSTTAPTADALRTLESGYVGRSFHVRAYEVGQFSGAPTNLRDAYWQDVGFVFETRLVVVDDRTGPSASTVDSAVPSRAKVP